MFMGGGRSFLFSGVVLGGPRTERAERALAAENSVHKSKVRSRASGAGRRGGGERRWRIERAASGRNLETVRNGEGVRSTSPAQRAKCAASATEREGAGDKHAPNRGRWRGP